MEPKDQLTLYNQILQQKELIEQAERKLHELYSMCKHPIPEKDPDPTGYYGEAICPVCKQNFGWYCTKSPDHSCHYYTIHPIEYKSIDFEVKPPVDQVVKLINGNLAVLDKPVKREYQTDDECLFCGDPDERK